MATAGGADSPRKRGLAGERDAAVVGHRARLREIISSNPSTGEDMQRDTDHLTGDLAHDGPNEEPWLLEVHKGSRFHDLVQRYYEYESEFRSEFSLYKASGRPGRSDLLLFAEDDLVVIVEVKDTDWDILAGRGTWRQNLLRHCRQVWQYLEGELKPEHVAGPRRRIDELWRQAALIYPRRPTTPGLDADIEAVLTGEITGVADDGTYESTAQGISLIWFYEPPPEDSPAYAAWVVMREGRLPPRRSRSARRRRQDK